MQALGSAWAKALAVHCAAVQLHQQSKEAVLWIV